jgi:hypothetical protein
MVGIPDSDTLEEARDKWAMEVGRSVLALGTIEGLTYVLLRWCPNEPIYQAVVCANLGLATRIEFLMAIAEGRCEQQWSTVSALLRKAKGLLHQRNLIAHNGLGFDIFIDATGEVSVEQVIGDGKKSKSVMEKRSARDKLAFREIVRHREQAEAIANELSGAVLKVLQLVGAERQRALAEKTKDKYRPNLTATESAARGSPPTSIPHAREPE